LLAVQPFLHRHGRVHRRRGRRDPRVPMSTAFDDVRVGSQATSPAVHLGSATNAGQLGALASLLESVRPCPDAELVELTWTHRGLPAGLAHLVATVTRCGPDRDAGAARIVQDLRLVDGAG